MRSIAAGFVVIGALAASDVPAYAAGDQSGIITFQAFFQQLLSSLKTDSSQTKTSGEQVAGTAVKAGEAKISSVLQNRTNLKIAEAKERYSYETGQGYNACMVTVGLADIAVARKERQQHGITLGNRDAAWLSAGGGSFNDTLSSLITLRQEVYCSDQEKDDLGAYCQTVGNGYDAGNSNAAVWLSHRAYGGEEAMTGLDYVDTVAPLPTVPEKGVNDARSAAQRLEAIQSGVIRNTARTALQNIILDGMAGSSATTE